MLKYINIRKNGSGSEDNVENKMKIVNYSIEEMRVKMEEAQKKYFGYKNLKHFQIEAVHAVFHKKDSFLVMATGMGKSLCYQIPSIMDEYKNKLTIVISPLISLMKDQVDNLNRKKISSVFLGSGQKKNNQKILSEIKQGLYNIVYCSPEYALNNKNLFMLLKNKILLVAIDEVHCMSEWGHDFRPSYRKLNELRTILNDIPFMCLTATCTKAVQSDILKNLNFSLNKCLIKRSSVNKTNIFYKVLEKTDIYDDLKNILDIPPYKSNERTRKFIDNSKICPYNSTLIYVNSKKDCENIYNFLHERGLLVKMYHADLSNEEKREAHEMFLKDEIQIVIATVAFGMGIDKPDIRRIIHYGFSRSLEAYVQQVGRAGRDGGDAEAILFFHINEESKSKNLILRENVANHMMEKNFKRVQHIINMFTQSSDYAYSTICRRKKIYDYFDEHPIKSLDINIFDNVNNKGVCFYIQKYDMFLCYKCDNCAYYINAIKKNKKILEKKISITNGANGKNENDFISIPNKIEDSVFSLTNEIDDTNKMYKYENVICINENKDEREGGMISLLSVPNILDNISDLTNELKILLNCVTSLNGKTGISTICKILIKSSESNIIKKGYHNIKEYGEGKHKSAAWWSAFIKVCRNDQFVEELLNYSNDMGYISIGITKKGENFINSDRKYIIPLPFFLSDNVMHEKKKKGAKNGAKRGGKNGAKNGAKGGGKNGGKNGEFNYSDYDQKNSTFETSENNKDDHTTFNVGSYSVKNKSKYIKEDSNIERHISSTINIDAFKYKEGEDNPIILKNEKNKNGIINLSENKYEYFNINKNKFVRESEYKEIKLTDDQIKESLMRILLRTRMLEARNQNIPPFQLISDQPLKDICNKRITQVHLIRKHVYNISPICSNTFLEKLASGIRGFCLLHDLDTNINLINENNDRKGESGYRMGLNDRGSTSEFGSTRVSNLTSVTNLLESFTYDNNNDNDKNGHSEISKFENSEYISNNQMNYNKANYIRKNESYDHRSSKFNNFNASNIRATASINEPASGFRTHENGRPHENSRTHENGRAHENRTRMNTINYNALDQFKYREEEAKPASMYRTPDSNFDSKFNHNFDSKFNDNFDKTLGKLGKSDIYTNVSNNKLERNKQTCHKDMNKLTNNDRAYGEFNFDKNKSNNLQQEQNEIFKQKLNEFASNDFPFINQVYQFDKDTKINKINKESKKDKLNFSDFVYNDNTSNNNKISFESRNKNIYCENSTDNRKNNNFDNLDPKKENNIPFIKDIEINKFDGNLVEVGYEKKKKFNLIESFAYDDKQNYEQDAFLHQTNMNDVQSFRELKKRKL
ncbi:ATP-dependent DNA helicase RecQ [Plasmodium yoelii]|uniref:DNA 3'-5' helicase n=3 Tax=Plasmodium yoelii TaxID=5861 RepID=Q7RQ32_PLAYO|nr:ATP-dependent DNA helicase RecQ [Plasmodium yoelii]EAA20564.1 ATP-dependent DNA helicase recQ-related [Plasmodium yoelii yoelii]WBY57922.1 ADP-dependent DNA helicase RecQ [Plasmodium yoelii yoelii]CDU85001.1 ATP-dependent DNA helicase, putative [Plasmodium yoelii]VTZ78897.1 ADP-dependent DNA helicase RecQ, putative [Plasmodium yoelii]|eukprot:XP_728999.1 ATP-dependent DNA helicase RecQ [Plasmodium yoelii]